MKFSCLQENLIKGLSLIRSVCGKDKGLPILSTILLKVKNGLLYISATNLEIGIMSTIRGMVEKDGVVAVDAKLFYDYILILPKEKIIFSVDDSFIISILCGAYSTKIRGVNPDDFPIIPFLKEEKTISIKGNELYLAFSHTLFASAQHSQTRPELQGVYVHIKDEKSISFITTDTYRLSYYSIPFLINQEIFKSCIIPIQTLIELQKIISSYIGEDVVISRNESQIQFTCGQVQIISKLISGTYPDYENIIPKNFSTSFILEREELIKAVRAASLFSKNDLYDVLFRIHPKEQGKGDVEILSSNILLGENTVVLEGEVRGIENSILLNYKYLIDWLGVMDDEKIITNIIDSSTACVLRGLGRENEYYLLMPILE